MKKYLLLLVIPFLLAATYQDLQRAAVSRRRGVVADVTAPTYQSGTIAVNGTTVTLNFDENVIVANQDDDEFDLDCDGASGNNVAQTYASGSGTTALVFTSASTIQNGETCNLDYSNAQADEFEDAAGNDLASPITDASITNNSTQGASFCAGGELFCEDFEGNSLSPDATSGVTEDDACNFDVGTNCDDGDWSSEVTDIVYDGSEAFCIYGGATTDYLRFNHTNSDEYYIDGWVYPSQNASGFGMIGGVNTSNANEGRMYYQGGEGMRSYYNGGLHKDSELTLTATTWNHIRLYIKEETSGIGNDGLIYFWHSTSDVDFDDNSPDVTFTSIADMGNIDADGFHVRGGPSGAYVCYDNMKMVDGAPTMP